jgi:hypothetical protein
MDKQKILQLFAQVLELIDLSIQYESTFGSGNPGINSSDGAWELSQVIFEKQIEVARLLDRDSFQLDSGLQGFQKYKNYMSSSLAAEIHIAVLNLYVLLEKERVKNEQFSTNELIFKQYQRTIAGMLDPKAVRKVMVDNE